MLPAESEGERTPPELAALRSLIAELDSIPRPTVSPHSDISTPHSDVADSPDNQQLLGAAQNHFELEHVLKEGDPNWGRVMVVIVFIGMLARKYVERKGGTQL